MRSMRGFLGPRDIFRNPEAIWRQFEPTSGDAPFDLVLSHSGDDFAVIGGYVVSARPPSPTPVQSHLQRSYPKDPTLQLPAKAHALHSPRARAY